MKNSVKQLLKQFSLILKKRANEKSIIADEVSEGLARYLSRKELIQIIKSKFKGTIPKEHNLLELENTELLDIIGDDLYILRFVIDTWCKKPETTIENPIVTVTVVKKEEPITKQTNKPIAIKKKPIIHGKSEK